MTSFRQLSATLNTGKALANRKLRISNTEDGPRYTEIMLEGRMLKKTKEKFYLFSSK